MHNDDPFSVEIPTFEHAATLARLKADTFIETFADDNDPDTLASHVAEAFAVHRVIAELADPSCSTAWVIDGEAPVGYMKMNLPPNDSEPTLSEGLEVEQIYFRRTHQGRGLGRRLIDHATAEAQARGLPFVWLGVWEHNSAAIRFYERLGFRDCGEHTFYLGDEGQRDLLMRLDLTAAR